MTEKKTIILASAIFCNAATLGDGGKIDCRGVFTSFLAWGYPTSVRTWQAILTLYDLPQGTTSISVSISYGRGKKTSLASADIERGKGGIGSAINIPLRYQFKEEGSYAVHFNVIGSTKVLKVPLKVTTQPWPRFTKSHLDFLRKNSGIPHSIRANIMCAGCSRPYVFEESVLPDQNLAEGVYAFPETGAFECKSCGHSLHLKDIQGQVRSSIKTAVSAAMRGRK